MRNIKNLKISKKILALVAAGTLVLTCSGCTSTKEANLLEGTILENAQIISFEDGHKDIAKKAYNSCDSCAGEQEHAMYYSMVTGEYYAPKYCPMNYIKFGTNLNKYSINGVESVINYLTVEELVKANSDGLTDEDINVIIERIFGENTQVQATK